MSRLAAYAAAVACFASAQAAPAISLGGEVWVDASYQDRFAQQSLAFDVSRALVSAEASLAPAWTAQFSYIAATGASARINDAYLEYRSSGLALQFGRVKMPYYDFVEESFSHRWALLRSQAERGAFLDYRDEGLRLVTPLAAGEALRLAATVRSGAENRASSNTRDADLGWNAALAWRATSHARLQISVDHETESARLSTPQRTAVVASLGLRGDSLAALFEFNSLSVSARGTSPSRQLTGFGAFAEYSFAAGLAAERDHGLLASAITGSDDYQAAMSESLRLSLGYYRKLSAQLRTALSAMHYSGHSSQPSGDGTLVSWFWAAKF